jgi:hypothetical protein
VSFTLHWPTVKWTLFSLTPGAVFIVIVIFLFREDYAPSQDTLDYLYSSIFQGLAALVAVSLAIVTYVSDRLEKSMEVHLADARRLMNQFESVQPDLLSSMDYDSMVSRVRKWFSGRIEPRISDLERSFAPFRVSRRAKGAAGKTKLKAKELPFIGDFERLQSHENEATFYSDMVSNLGRFQVAQKGRSKLPEEATTALGWAIGTIMSAVILLASADTVMTSAWPLTVTSASLLAVFYMGILLRTLVKAYFGGGRIQGVQETQLPDPNRVRILLDEVSQFLFTETDYYDS